MALCASCSNVLPDGARFCPACGNPVAQTAADERRVVTVLFADVVGYTALSEHLDPERVKRLIDRAFRALIVDIDEFGGRVDKVLGDGILALFGAPVAHEDDADRAIRAAIKMVGTLDAFVRDQSDLEGPLELRIGINTGEVLVGSVADSDDYTAMGDVVNVASRLQTMAPPGAIYVGDATADLTSDQIGLEVVDHLEVRGREQPERVWRVVGLRRRVPLAGSRSDVPFVGRATQLRLLDSVMSSVVAGRSAIVSVSGEAGAGKTRLVEESLSRFPSRNVTVFAGVCAPYGESNVWAPVATALLARMELDPSVPPAALRDLVRVQGVRLYGFRDTDLALDRFVEAVLHLLGHPSELDRVTPTQARETLFSMVVEGLRRRSRAAPIVVWIDDLQWADPLVIDLLHRVSRSLVDRPLLLITAQRDDVSVDWPPTDDHPITVRMPLEPLDRPDAELLIGAVMREPPEQALADRLFERSGGNPLFLTELAELADAEPESSALPGSLRALIAARLDRLDAGPRAIVDNAAVLGSSGSVNSLRVFAVEMGQEFRDDDLRAGVEAGLIDVDDAAWRFRSDVIREVAYQTLTKLARAQRHAGTASAMAHDPKVPVELVAHHAAAAAELVAELGDVPGVQPTIGRQAATLLRDATRRSLDVGAFNQAILASTRALDLEPDDPDLEREIMLLRAEAFVERREADPARRDATEALDLAVAAGDRHDEAIARRLLGVLDQRDGDLDTARANLGESVELFRALGDDVQLAASLRERGFAEVFGGSLDDAEWLLGEAEALSERLGDRRGRAWVRQHQAWVAFLSRNNELAETRLRLAADEFAELGDRSGSGWAAGMLAYLRFFERSFDEAERLATTVRDEALELGDRWAPAMMDALIAAIRLWSGRFTEAEELSRRALTGFRLLGDRFGMVQALAPRVRALVALGRSDEAERGIEEAMTLGDAFGNLALPSMVAAGSAVHLGLGDKAVVIGESAVERLQAMGADDSEAKCTLALALCQVDRAEDALALLLDVVADFPYAHAVRSIAAAMTGDGAAAIADGEAVIADGGSTYLDRILADVSMAAVVRREGDVSAAAEHLARARAAAREVGDRVAEAITNEATALFLDSAGAHRSDHLRPGWRTVLAALGDVR